MFYIPERLFLYNLVQCSNISIEKLCKDLDDSVNGNINVEIECLKNYIKKEKLILPKSFIKEFEKLKNNYISISQGNNTRRPKNPDYFLIKWYYIIKDAVNKIEKDIRGTKEYDGTIIDEINSYLGYFISEHDANAVSQKNFESILDPTGLPYKNNQNLLIQYLLSEMFPKITDLSNKSFLELLKTKNWEQFITYDIRKNKQVFFFSGDPNVISEKNFLENEIRGLFEIDNDDYAKIGDKLLNIRKKLVLVYENGILTSASDNNSHKPPLSNQEETYNSNSSTGYDSIISSNILAFMRWVPLLSDAPNDPRFLECIDAVIDTIRPKVLEYIKSVPKFSQQNINIFLDDKNMELRKILFSTLCKDDYIRLQVEKFYSEAFCQKGVIS